MFLTADYFSEWGERQYQCWMVEETRCSLPRGFTYCTSSRQLSKKKRMIKPHTHTSTTWAIQLRTDLEESEEVRVYVMIFPAFIFLQEKKGGKKEENNNDDKQHTKTKPRKDDKKEKGRMVSGEGRRQWPW